MRRSLNVLVASLVIGFMCQGVLQATSLYPIDKASMFEDSKGRHEGDLITVIIVEQAEARQRANTATGKDSEIAAGPGAGVLADLIPLFKIGGGDSFTADGSTSRGGSLTAKITTKVVEIWPNNTMRIEGRQKIVINDEEQEIIISGLVRERDVSADNTVLSTFIADAEIAFSGSGVVGDKNTPGLLTRLFNWLF